MLAGKEEKEKDRDYPQLKGDGGNVYGWKICLSNHYHQPNFKRKKQEKKIRKLLEIRIHHHFSWLGGPTPVPPSVPSLS